MEIVSDDRDKFLHSVPVSDLLDWMNGVNCHPSTWTLVGTTYVLGCTLSDGLKMAWKFSTNLWFNTNINVYSLQSDEIQCTFGEMTSDIGGICPWSGFSQPLWASSSLLCFILPHCALKPYLTQKHYIWNNMMTLQISKFMIQFLQ